MSAPRLHRATVAGRVRADAGLLVLTGIVVAVASALAAAVGPVTDHTADRAIAATVRDAGSRGAVVATFPRKDQDPRGSKRDPLSAVKLRQDTEYAQFTMPDDLEAVVSPGLATLSTPPLALQDAGPGRYLRLAFVDPSSGPPAVTYVAGGPPQASVGPDQAAVKVPSGGDPWPVQVAVSEAAAAALGLEPGDRLPAKDEQARQVDVRISGIYAPTDPDDEAWAAVPQLLHPVTGTTPQGVDTASAAALASADSLPDLRLAVPTDDLTQRVVFAPRPSQLTWRGSATLVQDVVSLKTSPGVARGKIAWDSQLDAVLADGRGQVAVARGQADVLLLGLLTCALLVLLQAAQLLVRRRAGSVILARERGASLAGIAGELLVESVAVTAVGLALGLGVAQLAAGGVGWWWLVPGVVVPCLAGPVLGVVTARATDARRVPANRSARRIAIRARRSQRYAAELVVLALAVLTFVALHQRGVSSGRDLGAAGAATWWGVAGALVVLRLLPPAAAYLLRRSRASARGVRFFALARMAQSGAGPLPMLVITVAVLHLTLGLALASTEHEGQSASALLAVGGDARLSTAPDRAVAAVADEVAAAPGVRAAVAGRVEDGVRASSLKQADVVRLVVVDASAYQRLLASSPLPDAPDLALLTRPATDRVPALLVGGDPGLRDRLVVRWDDATVPLEVVGTAPLVDASPDPVVVVDVNAFAAAGALADPGTVWAVGPEAASALRAAGGATGTVETYADELDARRDAPLASGLVRLAVGSAVLLLLLAALGVSLAAATDRPSRAGSLGRLRSLGLADRELRRVLVIELLTPVVVAVGAGLLLGIGASAAMFGSLGLEQVTGQSTPPALVLAWWALLSAPVLVLSVLAVARGEGAALRRTSLAQLLRAGDRR